MTSPLLNTITLPCGVVITNRLLKSAMSEGMGSKDFSPNQKHVTLYQRFAEGGAGIVVTGNVMIDEKGLGEPHNVVIEDERHLGALKAWAKAGQTEKTSLWVQLNHPGKQSPRFITKTPVAPSAIPLTGAIKAAFNPPRALEIEEILDLINRFKTAAGIVKKAGFGGVQIHAAHGYLISQFLSPIHNQRTDSYGGSSENRMRFLVDIYEAIRSEVGPSYPVSIKINIDDFKDGGFTPAESVHVIKVLEEKGLDLVELSGGSYEKPVMMGQSETEGYFLKTIKAIRHEIKIPLAITGGFRSLKVMEDVINHNEADLIGLARPLVLNPDIPRHIEAGTYETIHLPRLTTGFKKIDKVLGPILGLSAYEFHLQHMAQNKPVKPTKNAYKVLFLLIKSQGFQIFKKRRA
jgi:2,4-dienoyl-CoA reductase-like NADH-dependent reductase (Old Yellow Enzyme family)